MANSKLYDFNLEETIVRLNYKKTITGFVSLVEEKSG